MLFYIPEWLCWIFLTIVLVSRLCDLVTPYYKRKIAKSGTDRTAVTYSSTQATNCAQCGKHKHTPLRIDSMDGYVCLTCIDKKLSSLLGEFGYASDQSENAARYRWLRNVAFQAGQIDGRMVWCVEGEGCSTVSPIHGDALDHAIDAALLKNENNI